MTVTELKTRIASGEALSDIEHEEVVLQMQSDLLYLREEMPQLYIVLLDFIATSRGFGEV